MEDQAPKENPPKDFNKIDLTQLQSFSFGTQWTQDKTVARDSRREERPRREGSPERRDDRGPGAGAGAPDRRDRRAFRKPDGTAPVETGAPAPSGLGGDNRPPRRDYAGGGGDTRGPRRDGPGEYRGGPRRDGAGGGDRHAPWGGSQEQRGPYDSPYFTSTFYPEDVSFATLAKTIRASCRTFELFDIARTVIGKPDRFVVVLQRRAAGEGAPATAEAAKPAPLAISVPDGIPFESEDAAIAHVVGKHLGLFFDTAEAEIEPPKGNFQVVNRCGITGELLGPPNYHRYAQIIQQHYAAKLAARMSFDSFRAKIETVRDPEVIAQWIEKMKKTTRYTWKTPGKPAAAKVGPSPAATEAPAAPVAAESVSETPAPATAPEAVEATAPSNPDAKPDAAAPAGDAPAPAAAAEAAPAAPAPLTFDSLEEARTHLLTTSRDKVVRALEHARFHGKIIETIPPGEIRRAVEGTLERQHRFPLDTANALRGRLRREGFTIFKKGSKGISYVCAVKRKFRVPGQVFAETIGNLISFIEAHPMIKASELPAKFLKIAPPPAPAAPAAGEAPAAPPAPAPLLTTEQRTQLGRMQGDLAWLVHEGYVTEFIDGRLFAAPAMVEARKKEIEASENDPENFPEAPASAAPFEAAPAAAPVVAEVTPAAAAPTPEASADVPPASV
jgi:hypothetical protein